MLKGSTGHLIANLRKSRPSLATTRKQLADQYRASRKTARGAKMLRKKLVNQHMTSKNPTSVRMPSAVKKKMGPIGRKQVN